MDWEDAASEYYLRARGGVSSLPAEWQRELVALMLVNWEVANGGYLQFFANHGREAYVYAGRAFRAIGARRMADIIDRCQALIDEHFPSEGRSSDERAQVLPSRLIICRDGRTVEKPGSVLPESVVSRMRELTWEFLGYPDNVAELAQSYYGPLIERDRPA